jgi:hypothetical protein
VFAHISVSDVATPDGVFSEVVDLFSPSCLYETVSMVPTEPTHNNESLHDDSIIRFDVVHVLQWPCTDHEKLER